MIDYDYKLTIDMGTKKPTYVPDEEYKGPLKNIFRIEGPNMSGKSTLMNLLAISAFGLKNNSINKVLKKHLEDMVHDRFTELTFRVNISDPVTGRAIRATRNSPNGDILIEDSDDGDIYSPISDDDFSRKYNLIYDIPDNPIDRLANISKEINSIHQDFSHKVNVLQGTVEDQIYDIESGPSKDELETYQRAVDEYNENDGKDPEIEGRKKSFESLARFYYATKIREARKNVDQLQKKSDDISRRENAKKQRPQNIRNNYRNNVAEIRRKAQPLSFSEMSILRDEISSLKLPQVSEAFNDFSDFNLDSIIEEKSVPKKYLDALSIIEESISGLDDGEERSMLNAMRDVIDALKKYKHQNISLPDIGPIDVLLNKLETDLDIQKRSASTPAIVGSVSQKVKRIRNALYEISSKVKDLEPPSEFGDEEQYCNTTLVENAKVDARRARTELTEICSASAEFNVDLTNYATVWSTASADLGHAYDRASLSEIQGAYNSERTKYLKALQDEKNVSIKIGRYMAALDEAKNKKKLNADHLSALKKISRALCSLKSAMDKGQKMLRLIEDKSYGSFDPSDPFFEAVWRYLGRRVEFIRYGEDTYPVRYVNTIDDVITATDGTILQLRQISTGLNQRNYLISKLQTDDSRPIIALFDEVSTMTNSTQKDIFDKFLELQRQGKLLVGMMNMPSDDKRVMSFGK